MASAGSTTVTTIGTLVFNAAHKLDCASQFHIGVSLASSYGALIRVEGLHQPDDYLPIAPGDGLVFSHPPLGIAQVFARGDGGTAIVVFGIVGRSYGFQ